MKRMISWTAVLGVTTLLIGIAGSSPARADEDYYVRRDGHHIYRDIAEVRRDEARLHDLERERAHAARDRDWGRVRFLDRRVTDVRWHIANDRRELRRDEYRRHE